MWYDNSRYIEEEKDILVFLLSDSITDKGKDINQPLRDFRNQ
jgi:hypothetical protein